MPQSPPWPSEPGTRPPLAPGSSAAWSPRPTVVLDRGSVPGGGAGAPGGPGGGPTVPRGWAIAVAVLSALLLVAVGALVWPRSEGIPEDAAPTTDSRSTTTLRPARPSTPPPTAGPPAVTPPLTTPPLGPAPTVAEVEAVVASLVPFVEQRRALAFNARPGVVVIDNAAFDDQSRAAFDRHADAWQRRSLALQILGVVEPQTDVASTFRTLEPIGQMARYDVVAKTIVVRAQPITPFTRAELVGALVSALDDQHFGADRPEHADSPDEIVWGFEALRAGDARRIGAAWEETLPQPERDALERAVQDAHVGVDLSRLRPALTELYAFNNDAGATFAAALAAGGNGPLDAAFGEPPRTTAEVLHPDRHLNKVPVVPVPPPATPGRVLHTGIFGELLTMATLADTLPPELASRVAAGWAGDSSVIYEGERGSPCIRIAYQASSTAALDGLRQAYETWAERHEGTEITVEGEVLTVSRCVAGGRGRNPA